MDSSVENNMPELLSKRTLPPLRHKQQLNDVNFPKKSHFITTRNFEQLENPKTAQEIENINVSKIHSAGRDTVKPLLAKFDNKPASGRKALYESVNEESIIATATESYELKTPTDILESKKFKEKNDNTNFDEKRDKKNIGSPSKLTSNTNFIDDASPNVVKDNIDPKKPETTNLNETKENFAKENQGNNQVYFRENFESFSPPPNLLQYYALSKIETLNMEKKEKTDYRKLALDLANLKKNKVYKRQRKYCDYVLVFNANDTDFISVSERALFERALRRDGLDLVYTELNGQMFVEIYAPFERLCKQAELVCLEMPLQGLEINEKYDYGIFNRCLKLLQSDTEVDMLSAPFSNSSKQIFFGVENKETFFRSAYRSMLVHHILENTRISLNEEHSRNPTYKTGIHALIHSKSYTEAFILHERSAYDSKFPMKKKHELSRTKKVEQVVDSRKHLHNTWLKWMKFQPLWKIRNYYGEKIALYFAWIGILITSLWIPTLLGLAVFFYGFMSAALDDHVKETSFNVTLKSFQGWTSQAMDNDATPFFAFVICIWGTVFLEIWKRKNASLAHKWDVENFEEQEVNRPQFYGTKMMQDPLTGFFEPYYPVWRKVMKSMGSAGIVLFMVFLVIVSVVSVVVYKVVARVDWFSSLKMGSLASSLTSSILNSISILVLGKLYSLLAVKLTDWENHRTSTKYNDALVLKLFGFQFVNSYASLFYIAFFREGTYDTGVFSMGKDYSDSCGTDNDCMSLLSLQVAVLMIVKPLPKLFADIILPFFMRLARRLCCCFVSNKIEASDINLQDESDVLYEQYLFSEYKKPRLRDFTLSEYTEKVLQYGYLMLFAAAFPLAPLIALITNVIDIRVDARRLLWLNRRPVPERAEDIGMWFTILSFLNFVGIFTNAFIIAITSRYGRQYQTSVVRHTVHAKDLFPYLNMTTSFTNTSSATSIISLTTETYKHLWIIVIFQNIALTIKFIVAYVIPDVPAAVERAKRQERIQLEKLLSRSGLKTGPGKSIHIQSPVKPLRNMGRDAVNKKSTQSSKGKTKKGKSEKRRGKKKSKVSFQQKNEIVETPSNDIEFGMIEKQPLV